MSNRWMKRADEMAVYGFGPKAMMAVKVCAHCGKQAPATGDYCTKCGKLLSSQTLLMTYQEMHPYCSVCGTVAPDCALYCPVCGAKLDDKNEELLIDGAKDK